MRRMVMAGLLASASWQASADFVTGSDLLSACEATQPDACLAYLKASVDIHNAWVDEKILSPRFCVPAGITAADLRVKLVRAFEENPRALSAGAGSLVAGMLRTSYPCQRGATNIVPERVFRYATRKGAEPPADPAPERVFHYATRKGAEPPADVPAH